MASILLTHSYFLRFDPKQLKQQQPYPPLGTLYAASVLRDAGFSIALHDTMFARSPDDIVATLNSKTPNYVVLYDDGFNYLTKMCLTNMREAAFRMIRLAKEYGCNVIVSSSDATDHYEQYLDNGADIVIFGEAERTLRETIQHFEASTSLEEIPGIAFRRGTTTLRTAKRAVMDDLDTLPFPAWDLIDIEQYKNAWNKRYGYFSLNVATTRGCPFKCNWCAKPIYGNRYNSRSPQNVVQELLELQRRFGIEHIWFCDDIFGLKPSWVQEFAEEVTRTGLKFRFKIQSRADLLLKSGTVEALAKAGCETIWMGAESGSQKILDAMDKGITVEQIYEATKTIKRYLMKPALFLQFGYVGETKEDIDATVQMVLDLMPTDIGVSVSYPLPGTVFYETVKQDLRTKANWTDSDDLSLMFRSTYPPAFYKRLHRFVHKLFRGRQAIQSLQNVLKHPSMLNSTQLRSALSIVYFLPAAAIDKLRLHFLLQHP